MPRHAHSARTNAVPGEAKQPLDHLKKTVPTEVSQAMKAAAHYSWAVTEDRSARTSNARAAMQQKFLDEAGGDPQRAESLRKAFYAKLNAASIAARRRNRQLREGGAVA